MAGLLITLAYCLACAGLGRAILSRWLKGVDPAAAAGVSGLTGLGAIGTLSLFIGNLPGGARWGLYLVALLGLIGLALVFRRRAEWRLSLPKGLENVFLIAFAFAFAIAAMGVLAPSSQVDWDTLAYHLAIPKLWIVAGHMYSVPFIHHSNFPQAVDNLYLWGLQWGGQSGAKAFSLGFLAYGLIALFGVGRQEYGRWAGWWAAVGFVSVPLVLWESGTAYIDVAHGLYAGLGIYFGAKLLSRPQEPQWLWLSGILLSLAAGSKYTGLQTILAVGATIAIGSILARRQKPGLKNAAMVALLALALASPWYIRNEIVKGNPVFPFFFSKLGGQGWDQRRADIYTHQQNTFGVGRKPADTLDEMAESPLEPTRIGHAILGLAYQPDRYIDPGQTTPGSYGAALLAGMLAWLFSGKARALECGLLGACLISFLMWFALTEQSRYIVPLAAPLSILLGGAAVRLRVGPLLGGIAALQCAYCLWLIETAVAIPELPAAIGMISPEDYEARTIAFYPGAQAINSLGPDSKTALYDEVFGFLLDVPYVWGNPGHSEIIPYDSLNTGREYADAMKRLGFTHVYVDAIPAGTTNLADAERWMAAAGLMGVPEPYAGAEKESLSRSFQQKFKLLIAEAAAEHDLEPVASGRRRDGLYRWVLFEIR